MFLRKQSEESTLHVPEGTDTKPCPQCDFPTQRYKLKCDACFYVDKSMKQEDKDRLMLACDRAVQEVKYGV